MRPSIATIPINDIFSETSGCPICRLRRMLEEQYVEFITGDAMMAPDVRVITNTVGFCHRHYSMMVNNGPRLSNALILQTHIDEVRKKVFPKNDSEPPNKKMLESIRELDHTCYVCGRIEADLIHMLRRIYMQYGSDPVFRERYAAQDFICLDHYALIMGNMEKKHMDKKTLKEFYEATNALSKGYIDTLYDDVSHFTTMFDYRNTGGDYKNSKDSIERSVNFITSYPVDVNLK